MFRLSFRIRAALGILIASGGLTACADDGGSPSAGSSGSTTDEATSSPATSASSTVGTTGDGSSTSAASDTNPDSDGTGSGGDAVCGDGVVDGDEECDEEGPACSSECTWVPGAQRWAVDATGLVPQAIAIDVDRVWVAGQTEEATAALRAYTLDGTEVAAVAFHGTEEFAQGLGVTLAEGGGLVIAGASGSPLPPDARTSWRVWSLDAAQQVQWDDISTPTETNQFGQAFGVARASGLYTVAGTATATDWFVRQYDADGEVQWTDADDSLGAARDIASRSDGSFVVVGSTPAGNAIRAYAPDGDILWTSSVPFITDPLVIDAPDPSSIAVGEDGLFVAGRGEPRGWVAKLSLDGAHLWSKPAIGPVQDLGLDPDGNLVLLTEADSGSVLVEVDAEALSAAEIAAEADTPAWTAVVPVDTPAASSVDALDGTVYVCGYDRAAAVPVGRVIALAG